MMISDNDNEYVVSLVDILTEVSCCKCLNY